MGRVVRLNGDEVQIRLSGVTAVAAIKRELTIPVGAIRSVSTAPLARSGIRIGGTSIRCIDYHQGRFVIGGRRYFLSFEDRLATVTLELERTDKRVGYDVVVVGVEEPPVLVHALQNAARHGG
jgi:hypothetical protein